MTNSDGDAPISSALALTIASCSLAVPFVMSLSSVPTPNHPWTLLWYTSLREPRFKPPDWAFPVAWTTVDGFLSVAAYRLLRAAPSSSRNTALKLWGWNVLLIGGWSRLFFKQHRLGLSTLAAAGLIATSTALTHEAKKVDTTASRATLPLVGWVTFATVLTATIWRLNSRRR